MTPMLRVTMLAGLVWTGLWSFAARAPAEDAPQSCDVPAYLLTTESLLPKVKAAIMGGKLDILVIGSRSSTIATSEGSAYPGRLQALLRDKLPTVQIDVTLDLQAKKTAEDVASQIGRMVEARKPQLVIWQAGTVDAMRSTDPDEFRAALDEGVTTLQAAGTDVILMNLQYSPRTETVISAAAYIDNMRVVAQQHDVPLFDRFSIMRQWSESGDFDLFSTAPGVGLAKRVHDCLARGLSTFLIDAAQVKPAELRIQR